VTPQPSGGIAQVSGTGEPGSVVQILVNNRVNSSVRVGNDGVWRAAVRLTAGQHRISVRGVLANSLFTPVTAPFAVTVPTPIPLPTPTPTAGAFELVTPSDRESGTGDRRFAWQTSFVPAEGQGFEIIFWRPGQDPLVNGFGLAAPTSDNGVTLKLSQLDNVLGDLLEPGEYNWGVLLVRTEPYERVRLLGGPRTFFYYRGDGGGGSGGGGQSSGEGGGGGESSGE
jgi:uncharacterized membrane protein YgcG